MDLLIFFMIKLDILIIKAGKYDKKINVVNRRQDFLIDPLKYLCKHKRFRLMYKNILVYFIEFLSIMAET